MSDQEYVTIPKRHFERTDDLLEQTTRERDQYKRNLHRALKWKRAWSRTARMYYHAAMCLDRDVKRLTLERDDLQIRLSVEQREGQMAHDLVSGLMAERDKWKGIAARLDSQLLLPNTTRAREEDRRDNAEA